MGIVFTGKPSNRTAVNENDARKFGAHRFWRVRIAANNGHENYVAINKLLLFDASNLSDTCTDNGDTDLYSASSATSIGDDSVEYLFGSASYNDSAWVSDQSISVSNTNGVDQDISAGFPVYVNIEFVEPKDIVRATFLNSGNPEGQAGFGGQGIEAAPTLVDIQYSDDEEHWITRMGGELSWPESAALDEFNPESEYFQSVESIFGVLTALPALTVEATGTGADFQELGADLTLPALSVYATINNEAAELPSLTAYGKGIPGNASNNLLPVELPALTADGVLAAGILSTGAVTLPRLEVEATGFQTGDLVGLVLPSLTAQAQGAIGLLGSGALTLPSLTVSADAVGPADLTGAVIGALTAQADGHVGTFIGAISARLPALDVAITATDTGEGVPLPSLSATGVAASGQAATVIAQLPRLEVSAAGYDESQLQGALLPSLHATATGLAGTFGPIYAQLPSLNVSIMQLNGEDETTLLALTATGEGVIGLPAQFFGYLQPLTVDAEGQFSAPDVASNGGIVGEFPSLDATGFAVSGNGYSGSSALPALVMAAEGVTGVQGTVVATLPALTVEGTLQSSIEIDVALVLPALRVFAVSTPATDELLTGNAVTMNVKHKGVTEFTGFGFNSFATFAGMTLACSDQGLFALVGDDDNGAVIDASIRLGKLDFDAQQLKSVDQLYVGYEAGGDLQVTAKADDGTEYTYLLERQQDVGRHTAKTKLGRGLKGRYFQLGVQNVNGAYFAIDTLEPEPRLLKRRIR